MQKGWRRSPKLKKSIASNQGATKEMVPLAKFIIINITNKEEK